MSDEIFVHVPVLLEELVSGLKLEKGDKVLDCTFGGGGHASVVLKQIGETGLLLGMDRDIDAINNAKVRYSEDLSAGRLVLHHGAFSDLKNALEDAGEEGVDAIYADLGVSSHQLDTAERGFSFQSIGPLDMRMNQSAGRSAAELVNEESEENLVQIFFTFGEEPKSRHYARKIVAERQRKPFTSTRELADFITAVSPYRTDSRKHPATKIFQALRMAVNDELEEIRVLLRDGFEVLRPGGRFAIISFHSLEDRLVKRAFNDYAGKATLKDIELAQAGIHRDRLARARIIKPFPGSATDSEQRSNPRSRTAKIRIIEKQEGTAA